MFDLGFLGEVRHCILIDVVECLGAKNNVIPKERMTLTRINRPIISFALLTLSRDMGRGPCINLLGRENHPLSREQLPLSGTTTTTDQPTSPNRFVSPRS